MSCHAQEVERLDAQLASLAREECALQLRLGQTLEVMGRGASGDLGFSSLAAYAAERCERSGRWVEAARCVARRAESLPELRRAMAFGVVSWSMGELLARVAQPEDERRWLELAAGRTVRQMRALVSEAISRTREAGNARLGALEPSADSRSSRVAESAMAAPALAEQAREDECSGESDICTLTCTVSHEDAWLFEATRSLLEQLGVHGPEGQAEALLAEAQGALLAALPRGALQLDEGQSDEAARQQWLAQLRRWRREAEMHCEASIAGSLQEARARNASSAGHPSTAVAAALGMASLAHASSQALDRAARALCEALARHELEVDELVLRFHRANGWRRLGYASEAQYARERLGMSASSLLARRSLALRLEKLPAIAAALGAGQIGVEAALQLVRVATEQSEAVWVARARRRTIKHLKEEVAAALTALRWSGHRECLPPTEAEMAEFHRLEQAVVSGRFDPLQSNAVAGAGVDEASVGPLAEHARGQRAAWRAMLGSLAAWLAGRLQTSAAATTASNGGASAGAGRVTVQLRVSRATRSWWRALEMQARRWLPCTVSWLRYACSSLWRAWQHLLGADVAYGRIYIRDRHRCASPVCNRRDVTPHHLRFRSAGGTDDDENVVSLCTWCHLHGIHGGRIQARGPATHVHWQLGAPRSPCLVVDGRERSMARASF